MYLVFTRMPGETEDVPLVEFMYLVFTRMPGESYSRRLRSLLCSCHVFHTLINSLVCWFCTGALGLVLFQNVNIHKSTFQQNVSVRKSTLHSITSSEICCTNTEDRKLFKKKKEKKKASTEGYLVPRTILLTPSSGFVSRVISCGISSKLPLSTKENRNMMASTPSLQACKTKRANLIMSDLMTTFNFWWPLSKKGTNLIMTFKFWRSLAKKGTNLMFFSFWRSLAKKGTNLIMT